MIGLQMDDMRHKNHGQASNPHAGHKMSNDHGSHDRHAGHSVAMFRDKFWLSFALTIPVVFWSSDVAEAKRRNVNQLSATNFEALAGRGPKALVEGESVLVGGPRLLTEAKITVPPEVGKLAATWATGGKTVLYAVAQGRLLGAFAVEDEIRPESSEAITALHRLGIRIAMITGDSKTVADSVARRIGIDEVAAEGLPADKASAGKRFQSGGKRVAMVGEGVNDAPPLANADVGVAICAG